MSSRSLQQEVRRDLFGQMAPGGAVLRLNHPETIQVLVGQADEDVDLNYRFGDI